VLLSTVSVASPPFAVHFNVGSCIHDSMLSLPLEYVVEYMLEYVVEYVVEYVLEYVVE
jgi:hypothetical protein